MRIAVCDDSAMDRVLLSYQLQKYFSGKTAAFELHEFESGDALLEEIQEGEEFNLIFLDIYMRPTLGIEVAHLLRAMQYRGSIIFLTASSEFALEGYDVQAAGYLLKPHDYDRLSVCMDRIVGEMAASTYQLRQRNRVLHIPYDEIEFVESSNSRCFLHRADGTVYTVYKKLGQIEQELEDRRFLRCHQSYLVNMDHIKQVDHQFLLDSDEQVLIRQHDLKAIRQQYLEYLENRER